jgi:hypothetical protein
VNPPLTLDELSPISVGSIPVSWQKALGVARPILHQAFSIFTDLTSDIIGSKMGQNYNMLMQEV